MRWPERLLRLIAALVGLAMASAVMYALVRGRAHQASLASIGSGVGFYGLISFAFFRRATGRKMDAFTWAAWAMFFLLCASDAKTTFGSAVLVTAAALAAGGSAIALRQERLARTRDAETSATPRATEHTPRS